jgi:hypothetical protein
MDKKVNYSAVVLTNKSQQLLINKFRSVIPEDWKIYADHMTIIFGAGLNAVNKSMDLGKSVDLKILKLGISDKVIAVNVEGYISTNKMPHITLAVNVNDGGKPFMSNNIKDWFDCDSVIVSGIVSEIY